MSDILPADLPFVAAPRIGLATFRRVLLGAHSPAAPSAAELYAIPPQYGLDPAIALAFFHHESTYGTRGVAAATRNWGNLRRGQGHQAGVVMGTSGSFATYRTWQDGLNDWCILIKRFYVGTRKLVTVRTALPVYAPSSDHNTPHRYADAVIADVARWMAEERAAPAGTAERYRVRASVTAGARVRRGPQRGAAIVGLLDAGQAWTGGEVQGDMIHDRVFGTSDRWIVDADGRAVWLPLLEQVD